MGRPTTLVVVVANLDADTGVPSIAWDPNNAIAASNFSTSMDIDDAQGGTHEVELYFVKTAPDAWDYHLVLVNPIPGSVCNGVWNLEVGSGSFAFDRAGALSTMLVNTAVVLMFDDAPTLQPITLFFGNPTDLGGSGRDGVTQLATFSSVSGQWHDGVAVPPRVVPPPPHPMATANVSITANLDANAAPAQGPFDAARAEETSNFTVDVTVYDALGAPHALFVSFAKTATNGWDEHVWLRRADITGGGAASAVEICSAAMVFSAAGALADVASSAPCSFDFVGAAPGQMMATFFGGSIADGCSGLQGLTQFASPCSLSAVTQDGHAAAGK